MKKNHFPVALRSAAAMLGQAYPSGLPPGDYLPLLALLYPQRSDRNLAHVISAVFGTVDVIVLNDLSKVESVDPSEMDRVRRLLVPFGYEEWLKEP